MKKLIQVSFAVASLVAIAPLAASAQQTATDQTDVTQVETVARLQDPQWASMHADEAQAEPAKFARKWRAHNALRLMRLEQGGN
jgi:hypothetical protein